MTNTAKKIEAAKHTIGPWEVAVKNDEYGKEVIIVGPSNGEESSVVCGCVMHEADLFLIAAAPELLEALKLVYEKNSTNFRLKAPDYLIDIVEAAIAKAEGR